MIDDIFDKLVVLPTHDVNIGNCAADVDAGRAHARPKGFEGDRTCDRRAQRECGAWKIAWYASVMHDAHGFWNLAGLTDAALLGGLSRLVGSGRRLLAEVVAHLGEVEERRLHLDSGYGSMFSYCLANLGLSEDEACRRIKVARLARRYSNIYPRLASGQLSLSVAALLEPHLSNSNSEELLNLVSRKSVAQVRELLASRFPRPDVPSTIRKLPTKQLAPRGADEGDATLSLPSSHVSRAHAAPTSMSPTEATPAEPASSSSSPLSKATITEARQNNAHAGAPVNHTRAVAPPVDDGFANAPPGDARAGTTSPTTPIHTPARRAGDVPPGRPAKAARVIEPLSTDRYKIQVTADTALKDKLELARDLMRHAQPDGDFAAILSRALDLLIEQLMKRRFGGTSNRHAAPRTDAAAAPTVQCPATPTQAAPCPRASTRRSAGKARRATSQSTHESIATPGSGEPPTKTISRSTRRTVSERDGLRCTWQGPDGIRCESRAWLEHDHADPRGRGGNSEPGNIRLLCRAHNQRAAELHYGRKHMTDAIARARKHRSSTQTPPVPQPPA